MTFIDSLPLSIEEFEEFKNIDWYIDKEIQIKLTITPLIQYRECNKYLQSKEEYESAKNWPLQLQQDICVNIIDYRNWIEPFKYSFKVYANYSYDGATIPRFFWRLIGAPSDPRFIVGALLHDVLCQHKEYINYDRKLATLILEKCCKCTGTNWLICKLMFWCTDLFQLIFRKW